MSFALFCPDCSRDYYFEVDDDQETLHVACGCGRSPVDEFIDDAEAAIGDIEVMPTDEWGDLKLN